MSYEACVKAKVSDCGFIIIILQQQIIIAYTFTRIFNDQTNYLL